MKKRKPKYYDIKIHVVDRPTLDEKYLTLNQIKVNLTCDLPAGMKAFVTKVESTTK